MEPQQSPQIKLEASYFMKLAAVLALVAIIWLGTNLFDDKTPLPTAANFEQIPTEENSLAAAEPLVTGAYLLPTNDLFFPIRKWSFEEPELTAQSVYVLETDSNKVLLQKDTQAVRPIASLSKLMTAMVVMERANLKDEVIVSQNAVDTEGQTGGLVEGETLSIESLLWAMLMESSNDAAMALAEKFSAQGGSASGGNGQFIDYMNRKAEDLGLAKTHFSDPSGLSMENVSTARDVTRLLRETIKNPLLAHILKTAETEISSSDKKYKHLLINTNKLLQKYPEIIAGKTGYIDEAGNCMVVATKSPNGQGVIFSVILGSQDKLGEMDKLLTWEKEGFIW